MGIFKRQNKEQKKEIYRKWGVVKYELYPMLVEKCSSIHDMKRRLQSAEQALQNEIMVRVGEFKKELEKEIVGSWGIKPFKGKGIEIEQEIFDILAGESIQTVSELLANLPRILDTFILDEMIQRKPETLKVKFPDDNIPRV